MCPESTTRSARFIVCMLVALAVATTSVRPARAASSASPILVLALWTDDADDPADALTQGLRNRVKAEARWSLVDAPQSFETLAIALRCPPKPDTACLQRIADHLRADHYVWGTVARKRPSQVVADVHLWSRGQPGVDATATYADNLTDANDTALRGVADRLYGKLMGAEPAMGVLVVHAGGAGGQVVVDGRERDGLRGGVARVTVDPGSHTIAVRIPGYHVPVQTASVGPNEERDVSFELTAPEGPSTPDEVRNSSATVGDHRLHGRGIAGYTAVGVGAALLVVSGIEGARWFHDKSVSDDDRQQVPRSVSDVCAQPVNAQASDACSRSSDAKTASTIGWALAGLGAAAVVTGIVLVVTDPGASSERPSSTAQGTRPRIEVTPELGGRVRGLDLRVAF